MKNVSLRAWPLPIMNGFRFSVGYPPPTPSPTTTPTLTPTSTVTPTVTPSSTHR